MNPQPHPFVPMSDDFPRICLSCGFREGMEWHRESSGKQKESGEKDDISFLVRSILYMASVVGYFHEVTWGGGTEEYGVWYRPRLPKWRHLPRLPYDGYGLPKIAVMTGFVEISRHREEVGVS